MNKKEKGDQELIESLKDNDKIRYLMDRNFRFLAVGLGLIMLILLYLIGLFFTVLIFMNGSLYLMILDLFYWVLIAYLLYNLIKIFLKSEKNRKEFFEKRRIKK